MAKCIRFSSILLCLVILITTFICVPAIAEGGKKAYVNGTGVALRTHPTTKEGERLTRISLDYVTVIGEAEGEQAEADGGNIWYKVRYGEYEGYIYGKYVVIQQDVTANFEEQLKLFPESYRESLRELKKIYPNWTFIADKLSVSFDAAVDAEYSEKFRKQVELSYKGGALGWRDPRCFENGSWKTYNGSNWTGASREAIAYFMDPRNFINSEYVYMFLQQSYDADVETVEGIRQIINGSFLEKGYDNNADAYINDIIAAATKYNVSSYVLASTIIIEQSVNGSALTSGTYPNYEGYYNFFNVGASGGTDAEVIASGLQHAKDNGWDTRLKSIEGGAKLLSDGYISNNQDTYYYKDFNVKNMVWWHQYAQSVYDAMISAARAREGYSANNQAALVFKIPVYTSIPVTVSAAPGSEMSPTTPSTPQEPAPTPTPPPTPTIPKGDPNGDGVIDSVDLAAIKLHILTIRDLTGDYFTAGDINSDNVIDSVDLAAVKLHILGIRPIS